MSSQRLKATQQYSQASKKQEDATHVASLLYVATLDRLKQNIKKKLSSEGSVQWNKSQPLRQIPIAPPGQKQGIKLHTPIHCPVMDGPSIKSLPSAGFVPSGICVMFHNAD